MQRERSVILGEKRKDLPFSENTVVDFTSQPTNKKQHVEILNEDYLNYSSNEEVPEQNLSIVEQSEEISNSQSLIEKNQEIYSLYADIKKNKLTLCEFHKQIKWIDPKKYFLPHVKKENKNNQNIFHYLIYFTWNKTEKDGLEKFKMEFNKLFKYIIKMAETHKKWQLLVETEYSELKKETPISPFIKTMFSKTENYYYPALIIEFIFKKVPDNPELLKYFDLSDNKLGNIIKLGIPGYEEFIGKIKLCRRAINYLIVQQILGILKKTDINSSLRENLFALMRNIFSSHNEIYATICHFADIYQPVRHLPILIQIFKQLCCDRYISSKPDYLIELLEKLSLNKSLFIDLDKSYPVFDNRQDVVPENDIAEDIGSNLLVYLSFHLKIDELNAQRIFEKLINIMHEQVKSTNLLEQNVFHRAFYNFRAAAMGLFIVLFEKIDADQLKRLLKARDKKNDSTPLDVAFFRLSLSAKSREKLVSAKKNRSKEEISDTAPGSLLEGIKFIISKIASGSFNINDYLRPDYQEQFNSIFAEVVKRPVSPNSSALQTAVPAQSSPIQLINSFSPGMINSPLINQFNQTILATVGDWSKKFDEQLQEKQKLIEQLELDKTQLEREIKNLEKINEDNTNEYQIQLLEVMTQLEEKKNSLNKLAQEKLNIENQISQKNEQINKLIQENLDKTEQLKNKKNNTAIQLKAIQARMSVTNARNIKFLQTQKKFFTTAKELKEKVKLLSEKNEVLINKNDKFLAEKNAWTAEREKLIQEQISISNSLEESKKENERFKIDLKEKESAFKKLIDEKEQLRSGKSDLESKRKELQIENVQLKQTINKLTKDNQVNLDEVQKKLEAEKKNAVLIKASLEEESKKYSKLEKQLTNKNEAFQKLVAEKEQLQAEKLLLKKEGDHWLREKNQCERKISEFKETNQQLTEQLNEANAELSRAQEFEKMTIGQLVKYSIYSKTSMPIINDSQSQHSSSEELGEKKNSNEMELEENRISKRELNIVFHPRLDPALAAICILKSGDARAKTHYYVDTFDEEMQNLSKRYQVSTIFRGQAANNMVGFWGETAFFFALRQKYAVKYNAQMITPDGQQICELQGTKNSVAIRIKIDFANHNKYLISLNNEKVYNSERIPHDICVTKSVIDGKQKIAKWDDNKRISFFEVKTTQKDYSENNAMSFSGRESELMVNSDAYYVIRIFNAGEEDVEYAKFKKISKF